MATAKLFQNGRSQAVRLPKAYRFEGMSEVQIERDGERVILTPLPRPSIEVLIAALERFDPLAPIPDRQQPAQVDARGWD